MTTLHRPHNSDDWIVPEKELDEMMQMFNVANGASVGDPIDIRVRNQFYKMEAQGKRMYKQTMVKIGIGV